MAEVENAVVFPEIGADDNTLAFRYLDLITKKNPDQATYPGELEALACDFAEAYGPRSFSAKSLRDRAAHFRAMGAF